MMKAINPKVWGASGWMILHRLSFVIKNTAEMHKVIEAFKIILPCPKCRNNLEGHLQKCPVPHKQAEIAEYIYKLHKRVNETIADKPKSCITFSQVEHIYKPMGINMDEKEWIFIQAIVAVHQGFYKETAEYKAALKTFLDIWVKYTHGMNVVFSVDNKQLLKDWIHKNKKSALMRFTECAVV
jgi:Erv1 / Alr family